MKHGWAKPSACGCLIVASKITRSARDEECLIRIAGCYFTRGVVWCHANGSAAGKGIGMKSPDPMGAYGCTWCHDIYDRRRKAPEGWTREQVEVAFWEGHARSLAKLIDKGLLKAA